MAPAFPSFALPHPAGRRARRWVLARIEPVAPPASSRSRLLRVTADPWWRTTELVAQLVDVPEDAVRRVFAGARRGGWIHDVGTGLELFDFDGGPALAAAEVGIVRAPPRHPFPFHRHTRRERIVVLEGTLHDGNNALAAGAFQDFAVGSAHAMAAGAEGAVFVVVIDPAESGEG